MMILVSGYLTWAWSPSSHDNCSISVVSYEGSKPGNFLASWIVTVAVVVVRISILVAIDHLSEMMMMMHCCQCLWESPEHQPVHYHYYDLFTHTMSFGLPWMDLEHFSLRLVMVRVWLPWNTPWHPRFTQLVHFSSIDSGDDGNNHGNGGQLLLGLDIHRFSRDWINCNHLGWHSYLPN